MTKIKLLIYSLLILQLSSCSFFITNEPIGYGAIIGNSDSNKNYPECKQGQRFNCYRRF